MPRTRNSSIDEVDSSASDRDADLDSVLMANGAKLIGMYLVGTVMTIGALILAPRIWKPLPLFQKFPYIEKSFCSTLIH